MNLNRLAHLDSSPPSTAAVSRAQEVGNQESTGISFLETRIPPPTEFTLFDIFIVETIIQNKKIYGDRRLARLFFDLPSATGQWERRRP
ncbi:MAG: hypothetical protein HY863_00965 [Chloroflexi bacterium]|nr:hypothetical protein [Chloroflexota bacterium]